MLVLGIPRGGVPVADEIARRLNAEPDVVVARKVPDTDAPELALGAVTVNSGYFLNEDVVQELAVSETCLEKAITREKAETKRREERFRDGRPVDDSEVQQILREDQVRQARRPVAAH